MSWSAFADVLLRNDAALLIVKVTVVLAFAGGAALAAHRASAARRHMVWFAALGSCAWLVLSSPIVPSVVIHARVLASPSVPATTAANVGRSPTIASVPQARVERRSTVADRQAPVASPPSRGNPVAAVWIIGCVALLLHYMVAYAGAMRLARRATTASTSALERELVQAARAVGVRRTIALGYSTRLSSPVTLGFAKPLVLLPADAESWSIERRRAVLVHEAAHVARHDWAAQSIGRVACALLWFHPLVWFAFARLRDEAERAADDCVLGSGISALEYAAHLLELARRPNAALPAAAAVGIVTSTHLERRFLAMLDNTRSRATVTSRVQRIGTSVALMAICPLASLRFAAPAASHPAPVVHRASVSAIATQLPRPHMTIVASRSRAIPTPPPVSVAQAAPPAPLAPLAPPALEHPDFSGKWMGDSTASAVDTITITQSAQSISIDRFDSTRPIRVHFALQNLPFDGSTVIGTVSGGGHAVPINASAVWEGSTLVINSHLQTDGKEVHSVERLTLSTDGKTQIAITRNFINGMDLWGGARTFVLRRISP